MRHAHRTNPIRANQGFIANIGFSAIVFLLMWITMTTPASASSDPYVFELSEEELPVGNRIEFSVHIFNKATGEPVTDAMIIADRIDMSPDGKPDRTTHLAHMSSDTPGVYRYRANLVVEGNWQLTLVAMIPGAEGMVEGKMILKAIVQ